MRHYSLDWESECRTHRHSVSIRICLLRSTYTVVVSESSRDGVRHESPVGGRPTEQEKEEVRDQEEGDQVHEDRLSRRSPPCHGFKKLNFSTVRLGCLGRLWGRSGCLPEPGPGDHLLEISVKDQHASHHVR